MEEIDGFLSDLTRLSKEDDQVQALRKIAIK